jgi:hypothetical protein
MTIVLIKSSLLSLNFVDIYKGGLKLSPQMKKIVLMLKKIYIRKWLNNEKIIIGYIDSERLLIIVLYLTSLLLLFLLLMFLFATLSIMIKSIVSLYLLQNRINFNLQTKTCNTSILLNFLNCKKCFTLT